MITSETAFLHMIVTFVELYGVYETIRIIKAWDIDHEPKIDEINALKEKEELPNICWPCGRKKGKNP